MICKLCLTDNKLVNSHIIPEFLYKTLYDEKTHRFICITADPSIVTYTKRKGYYEKLLCNDCEEVISKYETYASRFLRGMEKVKIIESEILFTVEGINYKYLKLFLLSILWRVHISSKDQFKYVNLGSHAELLRKMILDSDAGCPDRYLCFASYNPIDSPKLSRLIITPEMIKINDYRCYRLYFAGIMWLIVVSSHSKRFKNKEYALSESGNLFIFKDVKNSRQYFSEHAKIFRKYKKYLKLDN